MEETPTPSLSRMCKGFASLAWIEPNGKIHWMSMRYTHGSWAFVYLNPDREGAAYIPDSEQSSERLRQEGWIRVSSATDIDVRNINSISQEAWDAWSTIVTSCAGQISPHSDMTVTTSSKFTDYFKTTVGDFVEKYCSKRASDAYWSKLMGESLVRSLIRSVLQEDLTGFLDRTKDIDYESSFIDPTFEKAPAEKLKAKDVKRAWAAEADHQFMKSVIKVHWMSHTDEADPQRRIDAFLSLRGNNEISTMGYPPETTHISSQWGNFGIIIQGKVTLAANHMDDVMSGYLKEPSKEIASKYASSGIPRRTTSFSRNTRRDNYILDRDSLDTHFVQNNEFIVDNWKPVGFVVGKKAQSFLDGISLSIEYKLPQPDLKYAKAMLKYDLPIHDSSMSPIDRSKIEAALRGESVG